MGQCESAKTCCNQILNQENPFKQRNTFDDRELVKSQTDPHKIVLKFKSGSVYRGEIKDKYTRHGFGVQDWADGSKYVGNWENDRANGEGKLYHASGDIYEGFWKND